MTLKEQLSADFKEAMKARDTIKKDTINLARAAIKQIEVDKRIELTDEEIIPILTKEVKKRKDALGEFEKAGRMDLFDSYTKEIEVLSVYLPEALTSEEIKKIVLEAARTLNIEGGKQNMGKLMGAVMPKVKGVADGNDVRKCIEEFLS